MSGPWVILGSASVSRYNGCEQESFTPVHAGTGAYGREAASPVCDPAVSIDPDEPAVVSEGGIPAWIVRDPNRSAVLAAAPDETIVELDRGSPAAITDLAVDGRTLRWLHDGAPRSAELG